MKKLPKVYQNDFNKKISNNKEICYLSDTKEENIPTTNESTNVEVVLDEVFNGLGYAYNIPLKIKTSTKVYETSLIAKTKYNLITLDNEIIPIEEIINIEKKNN